MAKKIMNKLIKSEHDLITPREETRAGFISLALEKNYIATPYIEEAKTLKVFVSEIKKPKDLLQITDLRLSLLTASGLSDKALNHLTDEDKKSAIKNLIENFLEPAGKNFADELIYRYLLTKGDAIGGKARNLAGSLGEKKFLRTFVSILKLKGIVFHWKDNETDNWVVHSNNDTDIERRIKSVYWKSRNKNRLLIMNSNVPLVKKNVDLLILKGSVEELKINQSSIRDNPKNYIALGELKGGIDPAGADEHWKTANSALNRIRASFANENLKPFTFFVGAAIENAMAIEIFKQLQNETMNNAANLCNNQQLTALCDWIIQL